MYGPDVARCADKNGPNFDGLIQSGQKLVDIGRQPNSFEQIHKNRRKWTTHPGQVIFLGHFTQASSIATILNVPVRVFKHMHSRQFRTKSQRHVLHVTSAFKRRTLRWLQMTRKILKYEVLCINSLTCLRFWEPRGAKKKMEYCLLIGLV